MERKCLVMFIVVWSFVKMKNVHHLSQSCGVDGGQLRGINLFPMAGGRFSMLTIMADGWENWDPFAGVRWLGGHVTPRWLIVGWVGCMWWALKGNYQDFPMVWGRFSVLAIVDGWENVGTRLLSFTVGWTCGLKVAHCGMIGPHGDGFGVRASRLHIKWWGKSLGPPVPCRVVRSRQVFMCHLAHHVNECEQCVWWMKDRCFIGNV